MNYNYVMALIFFYFSLSLPISMVRHEAAEALGAVGGDLATQALQEFHEDSDAPVVVQESCQVALNIVDYWADDSTGNQE